MAEVAEFDALTHIKNANEAEQARKEGKPVPGLPVEKKEPPADADVGGDDDEDPKGGAPDPQRSARRRERGLVERAAKAEARAELLQELLDKGLSPKEAAAAVDGKAKEDPEPERKDFPDDIAYQRALGRWEGRQGATEVLEKAGKEGQQAAEYAEWLDGVKAMDKKAVEDKKLIPDFDEVAAAAVKAAEDDPTLRTDWNKQPTLFAMIQESDVRAFMLHHFAKNPDDLRKILELKPNQQINMFRRLEGRVELAYSTKNKGNVSETKELTAAERDAKLPKPSEAVAARGGVAADGAVPMFLDDGKTLNPAWKHKRNEESGMRR